MIENVYNFGAQETRETHLPNFRPLIISLSGRAQAGRSLQFSSFCPYWPCPRVRDRRPHLSSEGCSRKIFCPVSPSCKTMNSDGCVGKVGRGLCPLPSLHWCIAVARRRRRRYSVYVLSLSPALLCHGNLLRFQLERGAPFLPFFMSP